ncbi:hypothetical protein V6B95_13200 [Thermoanaerobacterium saccharolyticum]|uniref:Uncharacterized protein n=2 Tax=Thermoanaerobacterium TaxID=28895 RepID=W9EAJ5_9THEO|nr:MULTISPECIES: hypothetical protein [Thermoanaerobacterium]AFK86095.1 hypothetical protein Tsac_1082 [Thermoanaerobacterium saccharolyticum JW/SL-YS485]ETO39027.1 hypothetical protein V518_0802 [Thermoanaerobacterium aotearoense SCUT27]
MINKVYESFPRLVYSNSNIIECGGYFQNKIEKDEALTQEELTIASYLLSYLPTQVNLTKNELKNYFTKEEVLVLISLFTSTYLCNFSSAKEKLISNVRAAIYYESIDGIFNIDGEKLINKLENLTEFQAFTVLSMIEEAFFQGKVSDEEMKKIFNID